MKLSTKIKNLHYFYSVFFFKIRIESWGCDLSSHAYSLYMSVKSVMQIEQMCRVTFLSNLIH